MWFGQLEFVFRLDRIKSFFFTHFGIVERERMRICVKAFQVRVFEDGGEVRVKVGRCSGGAKRSNRKWKGSEKIEQAEVREVQISVSRKRPHDKLLLLRKLRAKEGNVLYFA